MPGTTPTLASSGSSSIAVDTDEGLIVPVMRNVGERDAEDLRAGLNRLRADVAARAIPPEELRGATIELWHDRRTFREPRGRATSGRDRRGRSHCPASGGAPRPTGGAANAAIVAYIRPPGGDGRRGSPLSGSA